MPAPTPAPAARICRRRTGTTGARPSRPQAGPDGSLPTSRAATAGAGGRPLHTVRRTPPSALRSCPCSLACQRLLALTGTASRCCTEEKRPRPGPPGRPSRRPPTRPERRHVDPPGRQLTRRQVRRIEGHLMPSQAVLRCPPLPPPAPVPAPFTPLSMGAGNGPHVPGPDPRRCPAGCARAAAGAAPEGARTRRTSGRHGLAVACGHRASVRHRGVWAGTRCRPVDRAPGGTGKPRTAHADRSPVRSGGHPGHVRRPVTRSRDRPSGEGPVPAHRPPASR
ncbi:hypothetical protein SAMN04490357_0463 [Streptomyces misionensis]|uniref:Uncharacterized protein n=1 Tax=Streptomyces misionensis TaxID=67331 RepID=A0A1H4MFL9_9ACTN|nr:hypothetical protein SAMN04490357_0463 [Streptomyces misionensis]